MTKEEMKEIVDDYCDELNAKCECTGCDCDNCAIDALYSYMKRLETGIAAEVSARILTALGDDKNETADSIREELDEIAYDYHFSISMDMDGGEEE